MLKGGRSLERNVSLRSGAHAQEALERLGHDVIALDVGPELVAQLRAEHPDVAFIALHGRDGEDGTVQTLLEAIGVPYTGSGPAACMRCTDKVLAKYLMREANIPTPDFHSFREAAIKELGAAEAVRANFTPSADPWLAGFTTRGKPSAASTSRTASPAPSSLIDASRKQWKSGVGMFASRIRYLARTLSVQRIHAAGPEPV